MTSQQHKLMIYFHSFEEKYVLCVGRMVVAIESLQGIVVLGTTGVLLPVSCVTGAVASPLWRRSASPDWSMRLQRTSGRAPWTLVRRQLQ